MRSPLSTIASSSGDTDVAIIGAGPYGLGLAAHLDERGVSHRIFGRPMQVWAQMPGGMYLKSYGFATTIPTPGRPRELELPDYCRTRDLEDREPIAIKTFAEYGQWLQRERVPQLEPVDVGSVTTEGDGFSLLLETGERFRARRVVFAIGLSYFENVPDVFGSLPADLVSHTAHHADFGRFEGKQVVVIGAGQSALQAAALLHEAGAAVQLVARESVHWSWKTEEQRRSIIDRIRVPQTVLGPGRDNWVLQHLPSLWHYASEEKRVEFTRRHLGPSGAWWLRHRVDGKVPIYTGVRIRSAERHGPRVALKVAAATGDTTVVADHVVAGTGYRVDVDRLSLLDPKLAHAIRQSDGAPRLSRHFESSVPGLYFVGPASAASFGPLFRFVAGAPYTVRTVANRLARTRSRRLVHVTGSQLPGLGSGELGG